MSPFAATPTADDAPSTDRALHDFRPQTFKSPASCDHCGKIVWGASAVKCETCGGSYHAKCQSLVRQGCGTMGAVRVKVQYTEDYVLPLPMYARILEVRIGGFFVLC